MAVAVPSCGSASLYRAYFKPGSLAAGFCAPPGKAKAAPIRVTESCSEEGLANGEADFSAGGGETVKATRS
jgi:hypothetical protein